MNDSAVPAPAGPIVVGTDGSPHARHAVLFALREAQLRGTGLRAVCAYDYTPARYTGYGWMAAPEGDGDLYEQLHDVPAWVTASCSAPARVSTRSTAKTAGAMRTPWPRPPI